MRNEIRRTNGMIVFRKNQGAFRRIERSEKKRSFVGTCSKHHGDGNSGIKVSIKARLFGEPTTRLITEAVMINEFNDDETLMNQNEWTYVRLTNMAIV